MRKSNIHIIWLLLRRNKKKWRHHITAHKGSLFIFCCFLRIYIFTNSFYLFFTFSFFFFSFFEKNFLSPKVTCLLNCLGYSNECYVKETSTTIATLILIGWPIFVSLYRTKIILVNAFNRLNNFNSRCVRGCMTVFHFLKTYVCCKHACICLSKIMSDIRQQPNRFSSGESILYLFSFSPIFLYFRYRFRVSLNLFL